jgi:hypothetical protein
VHETALLGTTKSARDGCQRIACLQSTHGLLGALTFSVFLPRSSYWGSQSRCYCPQVSPLLAISRPLARGWHPLPPRHPLRRVVRLVLIVAPVHVILLVGLGSALGDSSTSASYSPPCTNTSSSSCPPSSSSSGLSTLAASLERIISG